MHYTLYIMHYMSIYAHTHMCIYIYIYMHMSIPYTALQTYAPRPREEGPVDRLRGVAPGADAAPGAGMQHMHIYIYIYIHIYIYIYVYMYTHVSCVYDTCTSISYPII